MFHDPHNTFRPTDAFEYADAYRAAVLETPEKIRQRLALLNDRIDSLEGTPDPIPSYMLAAYRGYEDAIVFVELKILPGVVKIDDTDPTECEVMTTEGYRFKREVAV